MPRALISTLAALTIAASAADGQAHAAPHSSPFAWRGVVEGAYGPTWDHAARMRVLAWMPRHGFNAYVHAPKEDLYQRTLWRDPYPKAQQAQFAQEIRLARAHGIQWIPNLSPALPEIPTPAAPTSPPSAPVCFSCPSDLSAVLAKFEPFRQIGATTFMVSFDDVVKVLTNPQDVARYGTGDTGFGKANGDFLTRLLQALRSRTRGAQLLTVVADYSGTSDTPYLAGLRATLDPAVGVMWTGVAVPANHFTSADARAYGKLIRRTPLVWDNWTDDDTAGNALHAGTARIFLGPYERSPLAAHAVGGFFLNPMNEADLNLLPLATAGAWLRDPVHYRARQAWLRAVREMGYTPARLTESLRAWAETSYSTKLDLRDEAPTFTRLSAELLRNYAAGPWWPAWMMRLERELNDVVVAPAALRRLPDRPFVIEASPFLDSGAQAAGSGNLGAQLLRAERPALTVRRLSGGAFTGTARPPDPARAQSLRLRFRQQASLVDSNPRMVYGWRAGVAFDVPPSSAPPNKMDLWFGAVDALDGQWQGRSQQAAGAVRVTLNSRPVPLTTGGRFHLPRTACAKKLIATDGAGESTGFILQGCSHAEAG